MSTDYRTGKKILMSELFDGKLALYGITEFMAVPLTQQEHAALTQEVEQGIRVEHLEAVERLAFEDGRRRGHRCLWDGKSYVGAFPALGNDVAPSEFLGELTRYGDNDPTHILLTIEKVFDTEIFDEHEAQYWGFKDQQELDAAWGIACDDDRAMRLYGCPQAEPWTSEWSMRTVPSFSAASGLR